MKIYNCIFKPATTHNAVLIIKCIGKNKAEALIGAQAAFSKTGGNPNWLTEDMLKRAKTFKVKRSPDKPTKTPKIILRRKGEAI